MGEWRRVFAEPKRLGLIVLMAIICVSMFAVSLPVRPGPNELTHEIAAAEFAQSLVEKYRGLSFEQIKEELQGTLDRIYDFQEWKNPYEWFEPQFDTEEEARASISDIEYLLEAADKDDKYYNRAYFVFVSAVDDLIEQADYQSGYADYLDGVQTQAERQSMTSVFGAEGSFARRNLKKTAEEFDRLRGTEVTFGNNKGIEKWLGYKIGDYLSLLAIAVVVMSFLEERKKGLWSVIRNCKNGRLVLGLNRIMILVAVSLAFTFLFYGANLAVSLNVYGGWEGLGRSIQSIEAFKTCTLKMTIGEWLLQYFAVKAASLVAVGLLLWCILGIITNAQFSFAALGATIAAEYILYSFLPVQSFMNVFKYFNIFTYIHTSVMYTDYLNVNIFGKPVGIRELMLYALPIFVAVTIFGVLFIQSKIYPEGNKDVLGRTAYSINKLLDFFRIRLSLGGWELYKVLILELVCIILVLIVSASGSLRYVIMLNGTDNLYQLYLTDMEGPIDETTDDYLAAARENAAGRYNEAEMNMAIDRIEQRVETLRERAASGGYEPWMADEIVYSACYGGEYARDRQRLNSAIAIVFLCACCAGIAAFERQSGVTCMVRSLKYGRKAIIRRKAAVSVILATVVCAAVYIREFAEFVEFQSPKTYAAPVQNLDALASFPLKINMGQYLIILYLLRLLMMTLCSLAMMFFSGSAANIRTSYIICFSVFGFPALLIVFGVDFLKWFSPLVPISSAELMWNLGSGKIWYVAPWLVWSALSIAAYMVYRKKWCNG